MNPQPLFCPNDACPSRGCTDQGNIVIHDSLKQRYRCKLCRKTFTATRGTLLYRLQTKEQIVLLVVALLSYGCPIQAIVRAFGFDERTVARWQQKAGQHCQAVHEHLVQSQPRNLGQVQADEIRVKLQKRLIVWMALAIAVPTRLWLGGVISVHRDKTLIERVVARIKAQALCRPLLLVTDGLSTYVRAWQRAFRTPVRTGTRGRPALLAWPDLVIAQVIKHSQKNRVTGVIPRLVTGTAEQLKTLLPAKQVLNTAYIERLNATFRQRLGCLVRRSRCLAKHPATLEAGMYLVGSVYNFCTPHQSLRLACDQGRRRWVLRTPTMAAGITDRVWTVGELMTYRVPPDPFVPPKRRGRPPKQAPLPASESAPI